MKLFAFMQRVPHAAVVAAFWVACAAVGVLSLLPLTVPVPSTGWDKSNHALGFAVLALLGAVSWPCRRHRVLVGLAVYGGAIELAQAASGIRFGEWLDWGADLAGLAIGFLAWRWAARCTRGKHSAYIDM